MEIKPQFTTGIVGAAGLRYAIQKARASDGVWFQRHVWYKDQLGTHDPPIVEEWIVSGGAPEYHFRPVAISDKIEEIFSKTSFEF